MKKKYLIITFIILSILLISCSKKQNETNNFDMQIIEENILTELIFEDPITGFQIKYEENWIKNENFLGSTVIFLTLDEVNNEKIQSNLNIYVQDISKENISFEDYIENSINELNDFIENFNIIESEKIIRDEFKKHKLIFTGNLADYNFKWKQVWIYEENLVYILTYTTTENLYDRHIETIKKMINSFKTK